MREICQQMLKIRNYIYKIIFKNNLISSQLFTIKIKTLYLLHFFKSILLFLNYCTYLKLNIFFGYLQVSNHYNSMI